MFNIIRFSQYVLLVLWILPSGLLLAEGELSIKPGKYEITKTTKTSFDTVPAERTTEECITNPDLDPESILPDKENCEIRNLKTEVNKTSFEFTCTEPGKTSKLKGYAEYSVHGDMVSSEVKLEGTYKGQQLIVESSGSGKRIGDCSPGSEFNK